MACAPIHSAPARRAFVEALLSWFSRNRRDLPWRAPGTSAYGVLVSEVMSQQTPVARVAPSWVAWMNTWPTPEALAQAATADVLRAWGTLGYPRRALRLQECARAIVERHGGVVPDDVEALKQLPGVGEYTAAAVACFHYQQPVVAIDTNVRRVAHRVVGGRKLCPPPRVSDKKLVESLMPVAADGEVFSSAPTVAVSLMELGALVCTARTPECGKCPVSQWCAWQLSGRPEPDERQLAAARRRVQKFAGTDRQCRGVIMAALRADSSHRGVDVVDVSWPQRGQLLECAASLVADGLAVQREGLLFLP